MPLHRAASRSCKLATATMCFEKKMCVLYKKLRTTHRREYGNGEVDKEALVSGERPKHSPTTRRRVANRRESTDPHYEGSGSRLPEAWDR